MADSGGRLRIMRSRIYASFDLHGIPDRDEIYRLRTQEIPSNSFLSYRIVTLDGTTIVNYFDSFVTSDDELR